VDISRPECPPDISTDTWRLKLAILILPGIFSGDGLHDIPVLSHLAILYSPEIIEGCGSTAKRSFGYSQNVVANKNIVENLGD
jgi:hypothetical protein